MPEMLEVWSPLSNAFLQASPTIISPTDIERYEGFYASVLYAYFASIGVDIIAEDVSNKGRIDLTLKAGGRTFLFEFKVTDQEPLEQIETMKYYEKYEGERYLIGIVFDPKARNVSKFEWERL
jgi:PD-(D/E)XK nuclease superfamily